MNVCLNSASFACCAKATRSAKVPEEFPLIDIKSTPARLEKASSKCADTGSLVEDSPDRLANADEKAAFCMLLSSGNFSLNDAAASRTMSSCNAEPMDASKPDTACNCRFAAAVRSSFIFNTIAFLYAPILASVSPLKSARYSTHLASFAKRCIAFTMLSSPSITSCAVFCAAMYSFRRAVLAKPRLTSIHTVVHHMLVPKTFMPK
mmetsp:Transcript_95211/g.150556  ORF Transcript_95211/g.150556 Transcript_95211/m.150556 type:complete len:206 (+) Transcript_95211:381-998(+)